ncbi:MAG: 1-(5-phosphoribosyl)-5-[(5-phosphoribosylamino)methylideneamino]imidazole-4-carboxamide isomerase [Sedimentisphaerales bacterium]|nr:1-(5-phosphoribosyl)-5-[(5-phosphoribosylamino)methylideneamino]imidazole-4-carboxamide isomerase [Sedimentisphaerales bacterium]MBN2843286.1 1-(5-phosphoribosyl)-5-[(5-phosphoribosylamino)methylideneamino]imidazole-4-carboxamide isomerase [Sedimentisphaerales bacterium]
MYILPAIDLRDGKCVRLIQGDYNRQINYNDDPVAQALLFEQQGAQWLHIVDLDGALHGDQYNLNVLKDIRESTSLNIEVGGGIRTEDSIAKLLETGINRVILGTSAFEQQQWFHEMVRKYPQKIVLGMDAKNGMIATHGWTVTGKMTVLEMAQTVNNLPLAAIVYTDIAKDGMLTGPNLESTRELAENCLIPIIASGGVGTLQDIVNLKDLPIEGIITGRALYENKFTVAQAIKALE